jgi:hypothetical protein
MTLPICPTQARYVLVYIGKSADLQCLYLQDPGEDLQDLKCWQISEVINYDCHSEAANLSKCMVSASQHTSITVTVMVEKVDVLPIVANDPSPLPVYLHCFVCLSNLFSQDV